MDHLTNTEHEAKLWSSINEALRSYQEATGYRVKNIHLGDFNKVSLMTVDIGGGCLRTPYSLRIVKL